jgi:hypothetical protein
VYNFRRVRRRLLPLLLLAVACGSSEPRGACTGRPAPGQLGSVCGFENPEDVEAVPSAGILLVSQMRPLVGDGPGGGAISALTGPDARPRRLFPPGRVRREPVVGDPKCTTPPPDGAFAPHGIASQPGARPDLAGVAVVGHRYREAIELFDLEGRGDDATLVWRGCIPLPEGTVGNDVAFAPDGEIIVSNFQPSMQGFWLYYYNLMAGLGMNTGDVMGWTPRWRWRRIPRTEGRTPNGVAVSADGGTIFFAEVAAGRVTAVPRNAAATGGAPRRTRVPGNPDNLAWTSRRTLISGSHLGSTRMAGCFFGRTPCRSGWALVEIDPTTLEARTLLEHDGDVVGAVASAAEFDGCTYFGSVFDDRIGVVCPAPRQEAR